MSIIYAWPPLKNLTITPSHEIGTRQSRGALSGRDYPSSIGAARRTLSLTCSALAGDRDGAGMCESLNLMLDGGINLARVEIPPINWHRDSWDAPFDLSGAAMVGTVTTSGPFDAIALTGLVPGALVCRAFDLVGSYVSGVLAASARAVRTVRAELDGTAVIALHAALPAGVIRVGETETAVFRALSMTPSPQGTRGDWSYSWSLREVLTEELSGTETEVDPW